jgi:transmembrane sensor
MDDQTPDLPEGVKIMLRNDPEDAWKKLQPSLRDKKPIIPIWQTWLRVAASIALLIGIGSVIYLTIFRAPETHFVVNNTFASKSVVLPDSSVVYLHPHAEISYGQSYDDNRNVTVKGQAFFEVQRDPTHPFKVTIGQSVVQVLGTSFNIEDDTRYLDVTVATGKVSVETPTHDVVILEKGEKSSYDKSTHMITKLVNNNLNYDSWRTKVLRFENTPLTEVFETLAKYFGVKIAFDQKKASTITYTSDFDNPTLQDVLLEMKDVLGITYEQSRTNVIVKIP